MAARSNDVIAALATLPGPAERAVVRLSGGGLIAAAADLLPPGCPMPGSERAALSGELEWAAGARVPVELLVFPGPASATGEDVLELHLPGSAPVVEAVLAGLLERGARLAEPGEFTRRAFLLGRLDLMQAEAVLELVESRSAAAAAAAGALLAGPLGGGIRAAREALAAALTELEGGLDFEEGDSQDLQPGDWLPLLDQAEAALRAGLRGEEQRRIRSGPPRIVLRGAANAGKTSLFRHLTGAQALVADHAGTTRDRLEAVWTPPGQDRAWILADGPGLGGAAVDARDEAARKRAGHDQAEVWWLLVDSSDPGSASPEDPSNAPSIVVFTKTDLPRLAPEAAVAESARLGPVVWVSTRDGTGVEELVEQTAVALAGAADAEDARRGAGERHRVALAASLEALGRVRSLIGRAASAELVAEEVRAALVPLGELVGELTPEDLLDRIFSRFCLGK